MLNKTRSELQTLNFPFTANEEINIPINGNYFKYESGTGEVIVTTSQGLKIRRSVGGAVKCSEFENIRVQDTSGAIDDKQFTIGYGEIKDNSVSGEIDVDTVGSITDPVLNKENYLVEHGKCFIGNIVCPVGGAVYAHGYLNNPVDSLYNLKLKQITVTNHSATTPYNFSLDKKVDVSLLTDLSATNICNKLSSGVDGVGKIFGVSYASRLTDYQIKKFRVNDGKHLDLISSVSNPYIIEPNNSIGVVLSNTVGVETSINFEWEEIII